jgi:hypothetical protein
MKILDFSSNTHSQVGKDGIISYILYMMDIHKGHFVEFGAWDGIHLSNCRRLYESGWSGTFVEPDHKKYCQLKDNYRFEPGVDCLNSFITPNNINRVLYEYDNIDFMSIDVDGIDIEIFERCELNPKIVCIKGGNAAYPFEKRVPMNKVDRVGQSLSVIKEIVESKGYKILCLFQDVIIVQERYFGIFEEMVPESMMEMYIDSYIYSSYRVIPMYVNRLMKMGRRNLILDYILHATNYYDYEIRERWCIEKGSDITRLLKLFSKKEM